MSLAAWVPGARDWQTPFYKALKIKLVKLNCSEIPFEIQIKRTQTKKHSKTITFSYLSSFSFCRQFIKWSSLIPTEHWLHSNNKLTQRVIRQAMQHHFHLLTSKHLAIKGSSSITLTIWGMKGLIQSNGQIKTLILATNADYALNQYLLTLITLFNWWWAHCPYTKRNSPLIFDAT